MNRKDVLMWPCEGDDCICHEGDHVHYSDFERTETTK